MRPLAPKTDMNRPFAVLCFCIAGLWGTGVSLCLGEATPDEIPAKFNRALKLGGAAPGWDGLPEIHRGKLGLEDLRESPLLVLFFTRNNCPMSKKYAQRIQDLSRDFGNRGVLFVAVNTSRKPGEDLDAMREKHRQRDWKFPYLKDLDGKLAKAYGPTVTPQFFLLNRERRIVYMGALDDHPDPRKVQEHYLKWAIEQVLAGNQVEIPESLPLGCEIEDPDDPLQ